MMKTLIIGMGIGALYKKVHEQLGFHVVTVDLTKPADYRSVTDAIKVHGTFDMVHICTPNHTHQKLAYELGDACKIMFVEKPGLISSTEWSKLVESFPTTRIMMVKNNMWRDNIEEMQAAYSKSSVVRAHWLNENRIPNPGSWFTNRQFSFGGVSRDLLPHLLSFVAALDPKYNSSLLLYRHAWQRWSLSDLISSDYGTVDLTGKYDVDDHTDLEFVVGGHRWYIQTSWKTNKPSDISISFDDSKFELGLCPENAYNKMITDAISNVDNDVFWQDQYHKDLWIHNNINL